MPRTRPAETAIDDGRSPHVAPRIPGRRRWIYWALSLIALLLYAIARLIPS